MITLVARRCVYALSSRSTSAILASLTRKPIASIRPLSLTPINYNFPNIEQMMDKLSKNPKALALFKAIEKDPKIMHAIQDLIVTMTKKGYIDLKNPTKQPSLSILADNEVRTKLFEVIRLLAAAGVFNTKDGANPTTALSNIMGLLMPSSSKDKKSDRLDEPKDSSPPKYDYTYDATSKDKNAQPVENSMHEWANKLKKMFK